MKRLRRPAALLLSITLLAGACGDDSDDSDDSDEARAEGESAAESGGDYCELARTMNEADRPPTDEEMLALKDAAPDEIAENVAYVADAVVDQGFEAFFEEDVQEQFGAIEQYEADVCGIEPSDEAELPEGVTTEVDPDAQQVAVSASEYMFDFDSPDAGPVSFVMTNDGEEPHHMIIALLGEGVGLDEALESDPDADDGTIVHYAETDIAMPGEEVALTFEDMEPGTYAMACFIPTGEGTPHAFEGMAVEFTVE